MHVISFIQKTHKNSTSIGLIKTKGILRGRKFKANCFTLIFKLGKHLSSAAAW
jgi:hypothetical protein